MPFILQIVSILFFFAFAWLSFKDIKNGIYVTIFLLPTYLVRFSIFGIPTTALEIMIYILFVLWFLQNKKQLNISESITKFYQSEKLLAVGATLLFLGVTLSTWHSTDLRTSLGVLKGWFFDPFLFFIVFTNEIKTRKQVADSLLSFVLSGFVVALISICYALHNIFTFDGRLRGFYESPNYLAMYLSPGFLFAVYLFALKESEDVFSSFRTDERSFFSVVKLYKVGSEVVKGFFGVPQNDSRRWQAVILLSLISVIVLTKSYGAILGITAALFCFLLKKYKSGNRQLFQKNKKALLVLASIALVVFSFLTFQKYEQIVNSSERSSLHSRFMIWDSSIAMLKDSPIFGIGPGTFQEVYLDYQSRFSVPYLEWAAPEPHNTFLAFYLQSGLIGFVGFILVIFWLLKKARTSDIVFLFFVYFLIHGLVDTLYWKNDLAMIFWLVLSVAVVEKRKLNTGPPVL